MKDNLYVDNIISGVSEELLAIKYYKRRPGQLWNKPSLTWHLGLPTVIEFGFGYEQWCGWKGFNYQHTGAKMKLFWWHYYLCSEIYCSWCWLYQGQRNRSGRFGFGWTINYKIKRKNFCFAFQVILYADIFCCLYLSVMYNIFHANSVFKVVFVP